MGNQEQLNQMPPAAQNAKGILEEYLDLIKKMDEENKGDDSQLPANEQIRLGGNDKLKNPDQLIAYVKDIINRLIAGDPQPVMRFISSYNINSDNDSILSSDKKWRDVLVDLEKQYGKVKPIYTSNTIEYPGGEKIQQIADGVCVVLTENGRERHGKEISPDEIYEVVSSAIHDGEINYTIKNKKGQEFSVVYFDIEPEVVKSSREILKDSK
jgi:hypothetical protein